MQRMHWLAAVMVIGCGGAAKPGPTAVGNGAGDPLVVAPAAGPVQFADVEARLLGARAIVVDFHIEAEGTVHTAAIKGDLRMTLDNQVRLRFSGTFDGQPVSIDRVLDAQSGAHLSEAIVIGMTRVGLLHNLGQIATGRGVEHADGGVADWVTVKQTASTDEDVALEVTVSGTVMGEARLEVDGLGLPRERTQTVRFPGGEMRVEEHYSTSTPDAIEGSVFETK